MFNESVGKGNRVFRKRKNMEEINRKMEKICEMCGKNDNFMIEWGRKRIQDLLLKHEKYNFKNN